LSHTPIHPFRFVQEIVAGDVERSTTITNWAVFITLFASQSASPATVRASHCAVVRRTTG